MKTIAQQLNITEFPFVIKDLNGNEIYRENSNRYWHRREYDSNGNLLYYESSTGYITDNRPKRKLTVGQVCDLLGEEIEIVKG